ncbi:YidH family protein [Nocardia sp. NPDC058705]|uniref:YidH family protein n=1 Tax=Nocardia sp. NPDC058705 TaxID=3346609 RepID=UPI0036B1592E
MTLPEVGAESGDGEEEVDYRFTLANERTFLAWIRTALGLLAGGVAVHTLVQPTRLAGFAGPISMICVVLSLVVAVIAFWHWRRVNHAMRAGGPLPGTLLVPGLSVGVAVVAALACLAVVLS